MAELRYGRSLLLLMTLPGGVLYWFSMHPFVSFWRRLGPALTATLHLAVLGLLAFVGFYLRGTLLRRQFGTNPILITIAVPLLVLSIAMRFYITKQLSMTILIGLPEFAPAKFRPRLLTEGIYSRLECAIRATLKSSSPCSVVHS
jgi:hypothetical protein